MARGKASALGSGGMLTKVGVARSGVDTLTASGGEENIMIRVALGERLCVLGFSLSGGLSNDSQAMARRSSLVWNVDAVQALRKEDS